MCDMKRYCTLDKESTYKTYLLYLLFVIFWTVIGNLVYSVLDSVILRSKYVSNCCVKSVSVIMYRKKCSCLLICKYSGTIMDNFLTPVNKHCSLALMK